MPAGFLLAVLLGASLSVHGARSARSNSVSIRRQIELSPGDVELKQIADGDEAQDEPEREANLTISVSQLKKEEIIELLAKDKHFLLHVQKDLLYIKSMKRRLPKLFEKQFAWSEKGAMGEIVDGTPDIAMTLIGLQDLGEIAKIGKDLYDFKKKGRYLYLLYQRRALYFAARAQLLVSLGRAGHTDYARDISLGHLYQTYRRVWKAVANTFYAEKHNWFNFKGKSKGQFSNQLPMIFKSLTKLDKAPAGKLQKGENFIIDRIKNHSIPMGGLGEKDKGWERPSVFGDDENFKATVSNAATPTQGMSEGIFGHLGDGRGWVQLDMTPTFGGAGAIYPPQQTVKVQAAEEKQMCQGAMDMLAKSVLPDGKYLQKLRKYTAATKEVTDDIWFKIGASATGVALGALAFFVPATAPVAAPAAIGLSLGKSGVEITANIGFEKMLDPILIFLLTSLAEFEFDMFNPGMKPKTKNAMCDFDSDWLSNFRSTLGSSERVPCDIVSDKCAEGMFCMRAGLFTHTSGRRSRKGYCMEAPWALVEDGGLCGQDSDCMSGACHLGKEVKNTKLVREDAEEESDDASNDESSYTPEVVNNAVKTVQDKVASAAATAAKAAAEAKKTIMKALGTTDLHELTPEVRRMLGVCVQPCDLSEPSCATMGRRAEFGYVRISTQQAAADIEDDKQDDDADDEFIA